MTPVFPYEYFVQKSMELNRKIYKLPRIFSKTISRCQKKAEYQERDCQRDFDKTDHAWKTRKKLSPHYSKFSTKLQKNL